MEVHPRLSEAVRTGTLATATKEDLQGYAAFLCTPEAQFNFSGQHWTQVGDTVRLMLLVRLSEESHTRALTLAKTAVWISCAAIAVALIDAGASVYALLK